MTIENKVSPSNRDAIVIIEDDQAASRSIAAILNDLNVPIHIYATGEECLRTCKLNEISCFVVDLRLHGMSGMEFIERLESLALIASTILISAYVDVPAAVKAMMHGAFTVLPKPYRDQDLWDSVVHSRKAYFERIEREHQRLEAQSALTHLSQEELAVLKLIVAGCSNKHMARVLDISLRTVDLRKRRILTKLNADSPTDLMRVICLGAPELLPVAKSTP